MKKFLLRRVAKIIRNCIILMTRIRKWAWVAGCDHEMETVSGSPKGVDIGDGLSIVPGILLHWKQCKHCGFVPKG